MRKSSMVVVGQLLHTVAKVGQDFPETDVGLLVNQSERPMSCTAGRYGFCPNSVLLMESIKVSVEWVAEYRGQALLSSYLENCRF